ncbi:uroporphyrinogen-III synthase [Rhinocladiella similis]
MTMPKPSTIPVLLLKTRSSPHDAYEEYFSSSSTSTSTTPTPTPTPSSDADGGSWAFQAHFVPVLEHRPNADNLEGLAELLKSGNLPDEYGGMIFTSQRAVEAWTDVVERVRVRVRAQPESEETTPPPYHLAEDDDSAFPIYTVGPATSRALRTLVDTEEKNRTLSSSSSSPFARLRPAVFGEHTGNGGSLAEYILSHYNQLHTRRLLKSTLYETSQSSPSPTPPVLGPSSQGGGGGGGDDRLDDDRRRSIQKKKKKKKKKGLLFLVGEQRRDIIPKTLMDVDGKLKLDPQERIHVDEVEVYKTETMDSFQHDFTVQLDVFRNRGLRLVVVVVFSPQGCEAMLRSLGFMDNTNTLTDRARHRWEHGQTESNPGPDPDGDAEQLKPVIVTIGPTTRDHLKKKYGFDADVCAEKPSPQGVGDGLRAFLQSKGIPY